MQRHLKLIAVDFDDTITSYRPYPEKAPLNPLAKKYLDKLHEKGFRIILWTSRLTNLTHDEAIDRCHNEFNMPYIEDDNVSLNHGVTGKLLADYYIDDKSSYGKVNWKKTYKYLIKNYK